MSSGVDDVVESVGGIPICPGCGLAAHITHDEICAECFHHREKWVGGSGICVVPVKGNIHTTPLCPEFEGGIWHQWRDEDALYYTMGDKNDASYCPNCAHYPAENPESETA